MDLLQSSRLLPWWRSKFSIFSNFPPTSPPSIFSLLPPPLSPSPYHPPLPPYQLRPIILTTASPPSCPPLPKTTKTTPPSHCPALRHQELMATIWHQTKVLLTTCNDIELRITEIVTRIQRYFPSKRKPRRQLPTPPGSEVTPIRRLLSSPPPPPPLSRINSLLSRQYRLVEMAILNYPS